MNFSKFKTLTRFEQTFFALPLILLAAMLSIVSEGFEQKVLFRLPLVLLAFLSARISGMAFNQLIDRKIDAENPRTQDRLLPQKKVTVLQVALIAWIALTTFISLSFFLSALVGVLSVFSSGILILYSYLKRFSASCHFVLGILHFLAPLIAYLALSDGLTLPILLLGLTAFLSIVANEIIYAMQDYFFDCAKGLHSIPVKMGLQRSLILAKVLHGLMICSSLFFGVAAQMHLLYYLAPLLLILFFHRFYESERKNFFFANTIVSSSLFIFSLLAVVCDL